MPYTMNPHNLMHNLIYKRIYKRIYNLTQLMAATALILTSSLAAAQANDVSIDAPRGGWRYNDSGSTSFVQPIHYPASSVNIEGQSANALIKGHIANTHKAGPGKLVVNGVGMPLAIDEGGNFARPYIFGTGSNGIEVRSADGKSSRRVQFYDASAGKPQVRMRVVLTWDTDGTDLDLHVISPDGDHVFYGHRVGSKGGALDVDVTTGYGPEIYSNSAPQSGVYQIYVNYYGSGERDDVTTAAVTIVTQEGTLSEKREMVQVPMRKAGDLTFIKSFVYP
jgi:uncharacterized protein YfaP (DUF2135 family)